MRMILALAAVAFVCAAPAWAQSAQQEATLTPAARAELDTFATGIATSDGSLVIAGHADASERDGVALSNDRAGIVRDYLASRGVSASRITVLAYGAERPLPSGGQAANNRRVEIEVGESSGWYAAPTLSHFNPLAYDAERNAQAVLTPAYDGQEDDQACG